MVAVTQGTAIHVLHDLTAVDVDHDVTLCGTQLAAAVHILVDGTAADGDRRSSDVVGVAVCGIAYRASLTATEDVGHRTTADGNRSVATNIGTLHGVGIGITFTGAIHIAHRSTADNYIGVTSDRTFLTTAIHISIRN